jgi:TRAP-type C4-dicarboxylate transport system permease small subunit
MKRQMTGGSYRGPLGLRRQRRTIRFTQVLLVLLAAGLLMWAGYSWGKSTGYDEGVGAEEVGAPAPPSATQTVVLAALGTGALLGALLLQGGPETVRIPTPARLDELAGRAESAAVDRAEKIADEQSQAKRG